MTWFSSYQVFVSKGGNFLYFGQKRVKILYAHIKIEFNHVNIINLFDSKLFFNFSQVHIKYRKNNDENNGN